MCGFFENRSAVSSSICTLEIIVSLKYIKHYIKILKFSFSFWICPVGYNGFLLSFTTVTVTVFKLCHRPDNMLKPVLWLLLQEDGSGEYSSLLLILLSAYSGTQILMYRSKTYWGKVEGVEEMVWYIPHSYSHSYLVQELELQLLIPRLVLCILQEERVLFHIGKKY